MAPPPRLRLSREPPSRLPPTSPASQVRIIATFLTRYLAGNPALPLILQLVDGVVKQNEAAAKRKLYALAIGAVSRGLGSLRRARLFTARAVEQGPFSRSSSARCSPRSSSQAGSEARTPARLVGRPAPPACARRFMGEWCVAGDVAMMASTSQVDLLKVLGVGPTAWTFLPALLAAALRTSTCTHLATRARLFTRAPAVNRLSPRRSSRCSAPPSRC